GGRTGTGRGGLWLAFGGARAAERAHIVEELVKTAHSLSGRRIGALIVVERTAGLRYYIELGVPLDALVSADLLETVFLPQSPLHDGAVIIQGDRARAACCFLPLSRSPQTGRPLRPRHRAALGLSEESDAVALIVSEETGRVTVAVDGRMETIPDPGTLHQRLQELIEGVPVAPVPPPAVPARLKLGACCRRSSRDTGTSSGGRSPSPPGFGCSSPSVSAVSSRWRRPSSTSAFPTMPSCCPILTIASSCSSRSAGGPSVGSQAMRFASGSTSPVCPKARASSPSRPRTSRRRPACGSRGSRRRASASRWPRPRKSRCAPSPACAGGRPVAMSWRASSSIPPLCS